MSVWASILLTTSILMPLLNAHVAKVWRPTWKVIGCARKSGQVRIKRKPFEMSFVSAFCQVEKMQIITEY